MVKDVDITSFELEHQEFTDIKFLYVGIEKGDSPFLFKEGAQKHKVFRRREPRVP